MKCPEMSMLKLVLKLSDFLVGPDGAAVFLICFGQDEKVIRSISSCQVSVNDTGK